MKIELRDLVALRHDARHLRRTIEGHVFDSTFRRRPFNRRVSLMLDLIAVIEDRIARMLGPRGIA